MDLQTIEKIKSKLSQKQMDPKQLCDWDNGEEIERLMIELKELQLSLEGQMSQSIESHLLSRQKAIQTLKEAVPFLEREKIRSKEPEDELLNVIQMVEVKKKIDYCLSKLDLMFNNQN